MTNQELLTNNIKPASGSGLNNSIQLVETATASAISSGGGRQQHHEMYSDHDSESITIHFTINRW